MGLREDLERYRIVGEERRQDLAEFIQYGDLGRSRRDSVRIPIKIVDLPEFAYDKRDMGGVGQGDGGTPDVGQPVGQPVGGDEGVGIGVRHGASPRAVSRASVRPAPGIPGRGGEAVGGGLWMR